MPALGFTPPASLEDWEDVDLDHSIGPWISGAGAEVGARATTSTCATATSEPGPAWRRRLLPRGRARPGQDRASTASTWSAARWTPWKRLRSGLDRQQPHDRGGLALIVLYNPQSCVEGRRRLPLPLLALGSQLPDETLRDRGRQRARRRRRPARALALLAARCGPAGAGRHRDARQPAPQRDPGHALAARAGAGARGGLGRLLPEPAHRRRAALGRWWTRWCAARARRRSWSGSRRRAAAAPLAAIAGLSWKDGGTRPPQPRPPVRAPRRLPARSRTTSSTDMEEYVIRTYLGERTLCHITSRGCPFPCNFCAITEVYQRRWLAEEPERRGRAGRALRARPRTSTRWSSSTATSWPPRRARWPSPTGCGRWACAGGARPASTP